MNQGWEAEDADASASESLTNEMHARTDRRRTSVSVSGVAAANVYYNRGTRAARQTSFPTVQLKKSAQLDTKGTHVLPFCGARHVSEISPLRYTVE